MAAPYADLKARGSTAVVHDDFARDIEKGIKAHRQPWNPPSLGLVPDSSVLIAAERRRLTPEQAVQTAQNTVGEMPIVLCALIVAEMGHGIIGPTRRR
jgi:hypothetical protein